jgi:hypothetical protein
MANAGLWKYNGTNIKINSMLVKNRRRILSHGNRSPPLDFIGVKEKMPMPA